MKILFITEKYPPIVVSGNRVYNLVKHLSKIHDISVFTRKKNRWLFPMPVDYTLPKIKSIKKFYFNINDNLLLLPIMSLFKLGLISNSKFYFNSGKKEIFKNKKLFKNFDLVVASGPSWHAFYLAEYLYDNFKIPYILDYRDPWISKNKIEQNIQKRIIHKSLKVVTVTKFSVNQIKQITNYNNKIELIENGINLDSLKQFQKIKSKNKKFHIGYAGSFVKYQGFKNLLEAINILPNSIKKNVFIEVCGKDINHTFEKLSNKFKINSNFYGHVNVDKVNQVLVKCDYLYSGQMIFNAIGGKIYHYLALNKPILLNTQKGSQLDLEFKKNKLGETSYSVKGLSKNIKQIYLNKQNNIFKKCNINEYIKNYDWKILSKKYNLVIKSINHKK